MSLQWQVIIKYLLFLFFVICTPSTRILTHWLKYYFIIFALDVLRTFLSIVYDIIFIKFISYACSAICVPFLFLRFIKKKRVRQTNWWYRLKRNICPSGKISDPLCVIVVCKLVCPSLHCKPKYLNSFSNSLEALYG